MRGKTSPFGAPFRKHAIKFLQNFRIDFEWIHRNVWSDLHKEVSIAGAKLQLLEPVFVNAIKFLQNVRIDFESIHENVMSDLEKRSLYQGQNFVCWSSFS